MAKIALLVVDVQKAYHEFPLMKSSVDLSLFTILPSIELFRQTKNPIFFIQNTDEYVPENSPSFELSPALKRLENEYQVIKHHANSFHKTDLHERLKKENVEFVVICGLSAGGCVNATVQGAMENGYKVAILQNGIAAIRDSYIQMTQETCPVVALEVLKYFLG